MTLKEIVVLGFILFFALFTRLLRLNYPSVMYFDELYHVPAAQMFSHGDFVTPFDPQQPSYDGTYIADWLHPPLAKYFQALAIYLFGNNAWAWRLPSLFCALLTIIVFYFFLRFLGQHFLFKREGLSRRNSLSINLALLGSFLLSLDGLFLVQSRIAMNDVFLLLFLVAASFAYFVYLALGRNVWLFVTGLLLAAALASKWTIIWIIVLFFAREFLAMKNFKKLPFLVFSLLITPAFIYLLLYWPMFAAGKTFTDFLMLQKTIAWSHLSNPNTHLYSSQPLAWLFNLRSVWYFSAIQPAGLVANIYALDNPLLNLYLLGALFCTVSFLLKNKRASAVRDTLALLFLIFLFSFTPWLLFSRPMFIYHYLPAIPFLITFLAYFLLSFVEQIKDVNHRRAVFFNLLFWPLLIFVIFYPNWVALPVPETFANAVYFLVPFWR